LVATAAVIALITLAILDAGGRSRLGSFSSGFTANPFFDFFRYLPSTLELIVVSFLTASIVGLGLTLLLGARLKSLATGIAVLLRCIPFFWLALAISVIGTYTRLPMFGRISAGPFMLGDHLLHLILPAGVLALFQVPPIMEYFNGRFARGMNVRTAGRSVFSGLRAQFVTLLPDVFAATMFTEVVFAWPGDGRLFFELARVGGTGYEIVAVLSLTALCILLARFLVNSALPRTGEATEADG
jgi:peptide/nickel transport system permease protein